MDKAISPRVRQQIKKLLGLSSTIQLRGPFTSWSEAKKKSKGYDSGQILSAVLGAAQLAQAQERTFERDSVLVGSEDRSWPITASLLFAASTLSSRFRVLDFGGSLGSTYFHNRDFLEATKLEWVVIEQKNYVEAGRRYFEEDGLVFTEQIPSSFDDCLALVVLISSSLQYVENPSAVLENLLDLKPEFVILDRTPFHEDDEDVLMVQDVPRQIYNSSYPLWIFSKSKLISSTQAHYELVTGFNSPEGTIFIKKSPVKFQGFLFRLRSS